MNKIFTSYQLADRKLRNRIVMAPMTRARAPFNSPNDETARYYGQRASAGLIVTEGTPISQEGNGFVNCPGIWSDDQIDAWKRVTQRVHDSGGTIFTQLWHVGRVSHTSLQAGCLPVSSTGKQAANSFAFGWVAVNEAGFVPASPPRALEDEEILRVVQDFAQAAANAIDAGFDGVEIHGANGYLLEQFLNASVNDRADQYGGATIENRTRFVLEVIDACMARIGAERVAIRLSPFGRLHDLARFDEEEDTFLHLARELDKRCLAYVHVMDQASRGAPAMPAGFLEKLRANYQGTIILAGGLDLASATKLIDQGVIDLAAFGVPFIANPDLVERFRHGWPIAVPDRDHYYGGDSRGYTDYPHHA